MNKPLFNEDDIQVFFDNHQSVIHTAEVDVKKEPTLNSTFIPKAPPIRVEFKPENKDKPSFTPPPPPPPPPGAMPKVQNSFVGQFGKKSPSIFQTSFKFLGIFVLIFIISFTIINGQALIMQMKYFYASEFKNQSWANDTAVPVPTTTESRLIIPKIKVDVPIIWNVNETDTLKNLENGAVHYKGTALPGQIGNVFITGHSSYYLWAPGNYKSVFALLDKLQAGDKIYVEYNGATFVYEVNNQRVVTPSNLTVLNSTTDKTLSLMTCIPVGTNLQRLIVTAKQISN